MSLGFIKRRSFMLGYEWHTVNGTGNINLPNSMRSNFRNIKLLGNSRHKTYAGTQLFDASKLSTTSSGGATVTNNGDGSFTISGAGTLSKSLYTAFNYTHSDTIKLLKAGKITFNALATTNPKLEVSFRNNTDAFFIVTNALNPVESAEIKQEYLDDPGCYLSISFYAGPESTIKAGTITPMLYQDGNGEWEPFAGGKPVTEPSPEIPLEIESCGKRKKNLLDFKTAKIFNSVKKPEMLDNGFVLNATDKNDRILYCECNLKAGKTYVLSYKSNKISGSANAKVSNHFPEINQYFNSGKPVVPNRDVSKIGFYINMENVPAKFAITDVQVEEGTTVTVYEPYSDKYFIDMKVTGKNLLDINGDKTGKYIENMKFSDGSIEFALEDDYGGGYVTFTKPFEPGEYTISANVTKNEIKMSGFRLGFDKEVTIEDNNLIYNNYYKKYFMNKYSKNVVISSSEPFDVMFSLNAEGNAAVGDIIKLTEIQVEQGGKATAYQPYTEQTVQIALDEPLRGYRRSVDGEIVKEMLNSGGVTRHFKEVTITKDTPIVCDLGQYGAPETNTILSRRAIGGFKKHGIILCKELKYKDNWQIDEESIAIVGDAIDFRLSRERLGLGSDTTTEENKAAVIKYLTDRPLHCVAELNEPTTEPLPESVQQQLQALHSENDATNIFINSGDIPAGIHATYKMKSN